MVLVYRQSTVLSAKWYVHVHTWVIICCVQVVECRRGCGIRLQNLTLSRNDCREQCVRDITHAYIQPYGEGWSIQRLGVFICFPMYIHKPIPRDMDMTNNWLPLHPVNMPEFDSCPRSCRYDSQFTLCKMARECTVLDIILYGQ